MKRRVFLKGTLASGAVAVAVSAGLLSPRKVLAAWSKPAFEAKSVQEGLKSALGTDLTTPSDAIEIKAPEIAENGAVVPVTVSTKLANTESISILVENNPTPLTAMFKLSPVTSPNVSTRIKMGKTSTVIAVVKSGGKLYSARKEVKVTIGGCGG
jgi:sulfur-oxidizing protein SoxY